MNRRDFERGLKGNDFTIGDKLWLDSFCFEVADYDLTRGWDKDNVDVEE